MKESHIKGPAEVGKSFDWRLADIPYQTVTLCEMFCITHGDHGVVYEREVAFAFDIE